MTRGATPIEVLTRHFDRRPLRTEPALPDASVLAGALACVHAHPQLCRLLELVVERNILFAPYDLIIDPAALVRGRLGERWNAGHRVVAADDVAITRNRGGDVHVFNATTGVTRFLLHDEAWRKHGAYATLDGFILNAMLAVVENIELEAIDPEDDLEDLRVAVEIAGEYMDDAWRDQALDRGLLVAQ